MNKKRGTLTIVKKKRDFGALTEISKELNIMFGDQTGRTVSMRTAHGFKDAFNLRDLDDESSEDLVHGLMTLTPILLSKKNDTANAIGVVLLAGLVGCYLNGKQTPIKKLSVGYPTNKG
ncbi:MAG: hypothetical protein HYZ42_17730 [Bacteroidetes bacterium]|nr:hypothetical protein [Bacteroidota bacterium]